MISSMRALLWVPPDVLLLPRRSCPFMSLVPYPITAFRFWTPLPKHPSFGVSSCNTVPAWSLTTVSLMPHKNSTERHPSAGSRSFLLEPTIALCLLLRLNTAPYGHCNYCNYSMHKVFSSQLQFQLTTNSQLVTIIN
jgi:hypothetical protein